MRHSRTREDTRIQLCAISTADTCHRRGKAEVRGTQQQRINMNFAPTWSSSTQHDSHLTEHRRSKNVGSKAVRMQRDMLAKTLWGPTLPNSRPLLGRDEQQVKRYGSIMQTKAPYGKIPARDHRPKARNHRHISLSCGVQGMQMELNPSHLRENSLRIKQKSNMNKNTTLQEPKHMSASLNM